jgi:hypothetical protein
MDENAIKAVDGSDLAPESVRMLQYVRTRAAEMSADAIRARIQAAVRELEEAVAAVSAGEARQQPIAGKWTIAEVVDHIAQTQVRAVEELRHLLAGRRPPLPPVYEALRTGAAQWAPWELLVGDLRDANRAMIEVLAGAGDEPSHDVTVRTVVVSLCKREDGRTEPQIFFAELPWKEYALLQRLHLLDHRTQVRNLHAAARGGAASA